MGREASTEVEAPLSLVDFIRRNPYEEDPTDYMIRELDSIACESGQALSEDDKSVLRRDSGRETPVLSGDARLRYRTLIRRRIEKDREEAIEHPGLSFSNAIEWAADGAMPLVCEIAIEIFEQDFPPEQPSLKRRIKDLIGLIGCGMLTVMLLMGAAALLGAIFHF